MALINTNLGQIPTIYASSLNDGKFSSYIPRIFIANHSIIYILRYTISNPIFITYLSKDINPVGSRQKSISINSNSSVNVLLDDGFPCKFYPNFSIGNLTNIAMSTKLPDVFPTTTELNIQIVSFSKNIDIKLRDIILSYINSNNNIPEYITISISRYMLYINSTGIPFIRPYITFTNTSDTTASITVNLPKFPSTFNSDGIDRVEDRFNLILTGINANTILFRYDLPRIKIPLLNNIFDDKDENYIILEATNDNKVTVQTPSGTPVNLVGAQTALATYSFDICNIFYLSGNTFFIIYNWQTSDTARSITYARIISVNQDGSIYLTTSRTIFAASLASWGIDTAGSCYSGNIFPLNFEDNREVKSLGVTYVRDHLTAANVNTQRTTWQGYYVIYSSTTASRITLLATQASNLASVASCVPSTGADIGYLDTLFDGMVHYNTNASNVTTYTTYISRTSATNVGAMGSFIGVGNIKDENDNAIPASFIGKLDDGNFVAVDGTAIYILQLQFTTTSGASKFKIRQKFTASDTPNETLTYTPGGMIMLRGGVLLDRINGYLYQIMEAPQASNDMYTIRCIGRSNYKNHYFKLSDNNTLQVARPRGVYSNTFYGINQGEPV